MTSLSGLSIGLSLVFGCLLLALVAELYYLIWWKKRNVEDDHHGNYAKELLHLFCWKKSTSLHASTGVELEPPDLELGSSTKKCFGGGEESVESELMRLHNLAGPPRFLYTIFESEDGRSSRTKSLSDLMLTDDQTPFLSPLPSPPMFKAHSLKNPLDSYHQRNGFNPLFESSPPPKFKFLRDAEEKLLRRLMMMHEAEKRVERNNGGSGVKAVINSNKTILTEEITEGSFLKFIVPSTSSQILPLASSHTTFQTHH